MATFLERQRRGVLVSETDAVDLREALFSKALPGAGEVQSMDLPQSYDEDSEQVVDPRNLALMVRPERLQDRVERMQHDIDEAQQQIEARWAELQAQAEAVEAREAAVAAREQELEALVMSAVEERVEILAEEQLAADRARLVSSVTQLEAVAHGLLDQARIDLLELAVKIAGRVIGAELQARPQVLVGLIRSALEAAAPTGRVTLHLNPRDHALLMKRGPKVLGRLPAGIQLQLKANDTVDRGGLLIDSKAGRVDATIAKRLERVGAQLAELAEG